MTSLGSAMTTRRRVMAATGAGAMAALLAAPAAEAEPVDSSTLDDRLASLVRTPAARTNAALRRTPATILVEDYRLPTDASDWYCWDRALTAAKAVPGPTIVRAGAREYQLSKSCSLAGHSQLTIEGAGIGATVISGMLHVKLDAAFSLRSGTEAASDITIRGMTIKGSLTNSDALGTDYARDSREFVIDWSKSAGIISSGTSGTRGLQAAIEFVGDLLPGGEYPSIRNVTVDRVELWGFRSIPVKLYGIRGYSRMTDSTAHRCLDIGFRSNQAVIFSGNRIRYSADNGVSISRGSQHVVCTGNDVLGSYYNGIWVGGWEDQSGPTGVVVVGNTIDRSARHGIYAAGGSKSLSIAGNVVTRSERLREWWEGCGIFVSGLDSTTVTDTDGDGSTDDERLTGSLSITGNTVADSDRGGILIERRCSNIVVSANVVMRPGRVAKPNGTAPSIAYGNESFGISTPDASGTTSNVLVTHNLIVDDRNGVSAPSASALTSASSAAEPASMGYGVFRPGGVPTWTANDNVSSGGSLVALDTAPRTLGDRIALGAPSAEVRMRVDKSPGGRCLLELRRAGAVQWTLTSNTAAEVGASKGSDLQVIAGRDDSSTVKVLTGRRTDGRLTVNSYAVVAPAAVRPDPASAGVGAMIFDSTLALPLFSDGTDWRTARGTLV